LGEEVADREAGLAPTDHDYFALFRDGAGHDVLRSERGGRGIGAASKSMEADPVRAASPIGAVPPWARLAPKRSLVYERETST
jgi:hypothetical protein